MRKASLVAPRHGWRPSRLLGVSAAIVLATAGVTAIANVPGLDGIQGTGHLSAGAGLDGIQGTGHLSAAPGLDGIQGTGHLSAAAGSDGIEGSG